MQIKEFLRRADIQDLLNENNLDEIYRIWFDELGNDVFILTAFFVDNDIQPLEYMSGTLPYMFLNTKIKNIVIPSNITYISRGCFSHCFELETIELPEGVTYIGDSAFYNCYKLREIHLPHTLEEIEYEAFYNCRRLNDVYYNGTAEEVDAIKIDETNDNLLELTWYKI